ncbi:MAG: DNA mismatch repair endonuclease MutL [Lachnospiraceae bacterium]|nr:DNA mismatch repair endonuclease MutL [Lachnospiraceae bacterium]
MEKIMLLDETTINKIAAGEVVERPASIVKELIENSVDAGATKITVEIKEGGISYIKISDNGKGIPKEEAELAFLRHATSKIREISDLLHSFSLGFRGEALSSIAAVSQLEMISRTSSEETGIKIIIEGGKLINKAEEASSIGTTFMIRNVFYNIPARRKFLKKTATESAYISDIVNKMALAHPEVSIEYINNDSTVLHTPGNNDLKSAMLYVYSKEVASKMIDIDYTYKGIRVHGLIGNPELSRANRSYELMFLNGRFIKSNVIMRAGEDAYKTRLPIGKFPFYIVKIEISPSEIDVNVHPTKLEVRFADEDIIYKAVYLAIDNAFKDSILIPDIKLDTPKESFTMEKNKTYSINIHKDRLHDFSEDKPYESKAYESAPHESKTEGSLKTYGDNSAGMKNEAKSFMKDFSQAFSGTLPVEDNGYKTTEFVKTSGSTYAVKDMSLNSAENISLDIEDKGYKFFNAYKIIGQIFNTYWIIEQSESVFIIDQHAAHERILFEKFSSALKNSKIMSQKLAVPYELDLNDMESDILNRYEKEIKSFGFDIKISGNEVQVSSVPILFKEPVSPSFLRDIIDTVSETPMENAYDRGSMTIALMACKAAVKGNNLLDLSEANALIRDLLLLENPFTCPHGRPTIVEISKYEMEKMFKRIQ